MCRDAMRHVANRKPTLDRKLRMPHPGIAARPNSRRHMCLHSAERAAAPSNPTPSRKSRVWRTRSLAKVRATGNRPTTLFGSTLGTRDRKGGQTGDVGTIGSWEEVWFESKIEGVLLSERRELLSFRMIM